MSLSRRELPDIWVRNCDFARYSVDGRRRAAFQRGILMNWKLFLQALAASAIAGSANAASQQLKTTTTPKADWGSVGASAMLGAATSVLAFLAQPHPPAVQAIADS